MHRLKIVVFMIITLSACGVTAKNAPMASSSTPVDWQDRSRECVSDSSFLIPLLSELDKYSDHADTIEITSTLVLTSRGCITLPEEIYPTPDRTFSTVGTASLGTISNWEAVCGGTHSGPLPGDCTGEGYEAIGAGTVTLVARSNTTDVPKLIVHFEIEIQATP